ncbi:MAG: hypothetical protein KKC46_20945 [Proteobacteria bacterium]|nr:hypothetical protein [Pseudomonadota bacterium]
MKPIRNSVVKSSGKMKTRPYIYLGLAIAIFLSAASMLAFADDTDIYRPKVRHNVTILVDNSDSMAFGVYDNDIDYHQFYKYICELCDGGACDWKAAWDPVAGGSGTGSAYYNDSNAFDRTKIYLLNGNIGFANGITGDAADPSYLWYGDGLADTKTYITAAGELKDINGKHPGEAGYEGRVSTVVDSTTGEVMVTFDGEPLPNNQEKKLHDWQENPDGSRVDKGFAGLIRAPGYTFSGYFYKSGGNSSLAATNPASSYTSDVNLAATDDGKAKDYFFITGNWINMQTVYNLWITTNQNKDYEAWTYCTYPAEFYTPVVDFYLVPPKDYDGNYFPAYDSLQDRDTNNIIYNGEASKIKVHFESLSLAAGDKIELYDESGTSGDPAIIITSMPADGWTGWITGKQVLVRFITDSDPDTVSTGWKIDSYQYQSKTDYKFFTRLEATIDAIINVVEATRGKVNWGVQAFGESHGTPAMNPSFNDDEQRQGVINNLLHFSASGPSNIAESLDLVLQEFNTRSDLIQRSCNQNFVITISDGYADNDTLGVDWNSSVTNYAELDNAEDTQYHYTQDPYQNPTPDPDYYDDIAGFMYSHRFLDYSPIPEDERERSADNIVVHNIGFSTESSMLKHASELSNGVYLTAYSKSQLVNAFYALGILIAEYTSYTAPVVSVDETNRVQSGDRLYMALFKPNESLYWTGNIKKYGLLYGEKPDCENDAEWYVVDKTNKSATTCVGEMIPETTSFWSSSFDGGDVEKGGVAQVLYNKIPYTSGKLTTTNATFRNIYKCDGSLNLVKVGTDTLTKAELGVPQDADVYDIVNFIYGYTYDSHTAATALDAGGDPLELGSPVSKRWPLGPIIHSSPKIIDYLDSGGILEKRYIAVGANDGMLHIFDNDSGDEVFAFMPTEVITKLKNFDPSKSDSQKVYTVDGSPMLLEYKDGSDNKKLLVFGLRRGGKAYYALDVSSKTAGDWTVKWKVTNSNLPELGLSFATPKHIKLDTGLGTYASYLLIPGGYDSDKEDRSDLTRNFELTSTFKDDTGRGIYILNIADGSIAKQFVYDSTLEPQMKYCFPADPNVVTGPKGVFSAAYMADIYGQVWKLSYNSNTSDFELNLIFKMNPMTDQRSDYYYKEQFSTWSTGDDHPDLASIKFDPALGADICNPRKTFYSPEVSSAGNCFTDVPVLYMGTGDREHPTFIGFTKSSTGCEPVKNGLYAFYDAHAYYNTNQGSYAENSEFFTEKDLLNVTCGAMEPDLLLFDTDPIKSSQTKANIKNFLREKEKGWYLLFSELDVCASVDNDEDFVNQNDHDGEKCIDPVTLFAKVVYAPTYQPNAINDNPCEYKGNARTFAVNYCTGNAVYNFFTDNDTDINDDGIIDKEDGDKKNYTRLDRYLSIGEHLPSGVSIVIRQGKAAGFISVGGRIYPLPEVDMPGSMIPFYWKEL